MQASAFSAGPYRVRTYLKNRIFKIAAGPSFKPQVRLRRIEDLKQGPNKDIEPKNISEIGSSL